MTSLRQLEANRENARRSTGPRTDEGKLESRRNALRHGLTAETVIEILEDPEDYKGFEANVIADYDARTAVERELVLRLASLLWRIRRATGMKPTCCASKQRSCASERMLPSKVASRSRWHPIRFIGRFAHSFRVPQCETAAAARVRREKDPTTLLESTASPRIVSTRPVL